MKVDQEQNLGVSSGAENQGKLLMFGWKDDLMEELKYTSNVIMAVKEEETRWELMGRRGLRLRKGDFF